jgi:hypothetical protein
MKKYFADLIQNNTNYRRNMRNIRLKHKLLIESSKEVTEKLGYQMLVKSIPFFVASIAFPIDMKKALFKAAELKPSECADI